MPKLFPILFLLFACSNLSTNKVESKVAVDTIRKEPQRSQDLSDPTNTLTGKIETLQLEYIAWGCACANWVKPSDFEKYQNDKLKFLFIFIEPASKDLELPLYFDARRHTIKVEGQFYKRPDYPKGTEETEEKLDKAKVFRYTKLEVIEKLIRYSPKDDITLTLTYNAIACTCAQWSESKFDDSHNKRERMFLERGNKKLIDPNKLY